MTKHPSSPRRLVTFLFLSLVCLPALRLNAVEPRLEEPRQHVSFLRGAAPASLNDLKAMQEHVRSLTQRVTPATVAVVVGAAQGSGVIISADGYVLTAAHVIGHSGQTARIYLHDGRRVIARTLGTNKTLDAGLLKIDDRASNGEAWPFAKLGDSSKIQAGQWCLAMGHPGGVQAAREPALRLGRVLNLDLPSAVTTDCTLIGGDSGGPLFNMNGEVIGVHSRIGGALTANLHIPANTYVDLWDRLAKGDNWGHLPGQEPFFGVQGDADRTDALITRVFARSPAEKAGLRTGDLVVRFGEQPVTSFDMLKQLVQEQDPGNLVNVEVLRNGKRVQLQVIMGRFQD